ncbi:unnamed protein product [Camellia sinensis]
MEGRESKGPPSADLLVCFPSRAHLKLIPNKPICSPSRPSERHHHHNHHHHHHHHHHHNPLKKSSFRGVGVGGGGGQASPLLWAKTKPMGSEIAEPTSPRVTCAGQIKVRPKPKAGSCKNWQSVMEEIERLHNNKKQKKRATWVESLGFKKDIMQFLTYLRRIRFDFRCFGTFPTTTGLTSDDDEDDEVEEVGIDNETSRTVFSKWFMVLQEEQSNRITKEESKERDKDKALKEEPIAPPTNALLLMRCRSAPAKSWIEEREEKEDEDEEREEEKEKKAKFAMEEEKKGKSLAVVMRYDNDFCKFSSDVAKETWVVGGMRDPFSRSRSWKR